MSKESSPNQDFLKPSEYKFLDIETKENATIYFSNRDPIMIDSQEMTPQQIAQKAGSNSYAIRFSKTIKGIIDIGKQTYVNFTSERKYLPGIIWIGGEIVDSCEMYQQYQPPYELPEIEKGYPRAIKLEHGALYPYSDNDDTLIPRP